MKVTVLGSGNGAYALGFHLVQLGHEVLMHTPEAFKAEIQAVEDAGCIEALQKYETSTSELFGVSKISKVTTDIKVAMEFSSVIMLIIPSFGQKSVFEAALPYLNKDHIWISLPGNFAYIEYLNVIKAHSKLDATKDLPFTMVEASSIPYACRKVGGNKVYIVGTKKEFQIGVYPSSRTEATVETIRSLFTLDLKVVKNVLAAGLCNLNFLLHPPITTFNAGWVEAKKGDFLFYKEGATKGVLSLMSGLDDERRKMAKSVGIELEDLLTAWKGWYGDKTATTLVEFIDNSKWYETIKAPATLNNRYYTEDLSFVLVPLVDYFKAKHGIEAPVAQAIITSARHLSGLELLNLRNLDDFPRSLDQL